MILKLYERDGECLYGFVFNKVAGVVEQLWL
jgi:hypothetical protein